MDNFLLLSIFSSTNIFLFSKTFGSFQLVEDFQQKAVAAGSEDAASVATLQKCEELLPGEVGTFLHLVVATVKRYDPWAVPSHPSIRVTA